MPGRCDECDIGLHASARRHGSRAFCVARTDALAVSLSVERLREHSGLRYLGNVPKKAYTIFLQLMGALRYWSGKYNFASSTES